MMARSRSRGRTSATMRRAKWPVRVCASSPPRRVDPVEGERYVPLGRVEDLVHLIAHVGGLGTGVLAHLPGVRRACGKRRRG